MPSRRHFLTVTLEAAAATWLGRGMSAAQCEASDPFAGGTLVGTVKLSGRGAGDPPLETLIGEGLDARLFTDLSKLTPETLVTPTERFFVRTSHPVGPGAGDLQRLQVKGLAKAPYDLAAAELSGRERPLGAHLLECAGNADPSNFGLMSVATWGGVPLVEIVERARPDAKASRVLVSGVDAHPQSRFRSVAGASWVFSFDELASTGAFLATRMNDRPLTPNHGAPVRLVVPGWYACACIKWVNEIVLQDEEAPSTSQMREYAGRTHQGRLPELAREYDAPVIDAAAVPVRIEKWKVGRGLLYKVVGIVWGGSVPLTSLRVRLGGPADEQVVPVCPPPSSTRTWALWTYAWRPREPGLYRIVITSANPAIRTRRLDMYYYARQAWIDEV